jgi:hypothetical protein
MGGREVSRSPQAAGPLGDATGGTPPLPRRAVYRTCLAFFFPIWDDFTARPLTRAKQGRRKKKGAAETIKIKYGGQNEYFKRRANRIVNIHYNVIRGIVDSWNTNI